MSLSQVLYSLGENHVLEYGDLHNEKELETCCVAILICLIPTVGHWATGGDSQWQGSGPFVHGSGW